MTVTTASGRPTVAGRRAGYVIAALLQAAMLYLVNVWPGWEVLPFLTEDMNRVLGLVNASILVSLAANLVYLIRDPAWLRALGDITTTTVGLVAVVRLLQVFPFDFSGSSFDWDLVVRILLVLGIVGSAIGIIVAIVRFVRALAALPVDRGASHT